MRAYVITTGAIFGLLTLAHLWRMVEEGAPLTTNLLYIATTALAAVLCLWAVVLIMRSRCR